MQRGSGVVGFEIKRRLIVHQNEEDIGPAHFGGQRGGNSERGEHAQTEEGHGEKGRRARFGAAARGDGTHAPRFAKTGVRESRDRGVIRLGAGPGNLLRLDA